MIIVDAVININTIQKKSLSKTWAISFQSLFSGSLTWFSSEFLRFAEGNIRSPPLYCLSSSRLEVLPSIGRNICTSPAILRSPLRKFIVLSWLLLCPLNRDLSDLLGLRDRTHSILDMYERMMTLAHRGTCLSGSLWCKLSVSTVRQTDTVPSAIVQARYTTAIRKGKV